MFRLVVRRAKKFPKRRQTSSLSPDVVCAILPPASRQPCLAASLFFIFIMADNSFCTGGMMLHGNSLEHGHSHHHRYLSTTMDMSMGTVMYMDGFHWALGSSSSGSPPPCLNLFFPSWTLYSHSRFVVGMASVTSLGILVEACGVWRTRCLRRGRARRRRRMVEEARGSSAGVAATMPTNPQSKRLMCIIVPKSVRHFFDTRCDLIAAALHASRILLGYLLMLAVMSYAVEFLISAVFGVVLGRERAEMFMSECSCT